MKKRSAISWRILALACVLLGGRAVGQSFTSLSGPFGGNVADIERDGSGNTYALVSNTPSNSILYKSTNNGDVWTKATIVTPSSGLFLLDILWSGTKMFGVYGNAFYVTTDGGVNWTKPATTFPFTQGRRLLRFGPNGFIAVYGTDGLYVTKDEGVTWTKALSDNVFIYSTDRTVANAAGDLYTMSRATANTTSFLIKKLVYPGVAGDFLEANWQTVYTSAINNTNAHLMAATTSSDLYLSISNDLLISQDGGSTWPSMKGNLTQTCFSGVGGVASNGKVYFVNNCLQEIYAATTPGTSPTWTVSTLTAVPTFGTSISSLAFISPTSILFGTFEAGVFGSTDSGATLVHKSVGITEARGLGAVMTNSGRLIYITGTFPRGYWTSTDGGVNWTFVSPGGNFASKVAKLGNGTIVLYGGSVVYYSINDGASFGTATQGCTDLAETPGGVLYAGQGVGTFGTSNDFGANWSPFAVTGWPAGYTVRAMSADATNIYVGGVSGPTVKLFSIAIADGMVTELTNFPPTNSLTNLFVANSKIYAVQNSNYFVSADQGATWTTVGFSGNAVFPLSDGTTTAICVGRSGSFYITQNDGLTWNSILMPTSTAYATSISLDPASSPSNPIYYLSAYQSPALKYTGKLIVDPATLPEYIDFNWQPLAGPYGGFATDLEFHPDGSMYALISGQIHKYASGTWTQLSPISASVTSITDLEIDNTGKIYALTISSTPRLYVSTNGGTSWTSRAGSFIFGTLYVTTKMEKMNDGSLIVLGNFGRIFRSVDDGDNFVVVKNTGTSTFNILQPVYKTGTFAAAVNTSDGVLISADNGQNWVARNNGLPLVNSLYNFGNLSMSPTGEMLISLPTAVNANNAPINWEIYRSVDQGLN